MPTHNWQGTNGVYSMVHAFQQIPLNLVWKRRKAKPLKMVNVTGEALVSCDVSGESRGLLSVSDFRHVCVSTVRNAIFRFLECMSEFTSSYTVLELSFGKQIQRPFEKFPT